MKENVQLKSGQKEVMGKYLRKQPYFVFHLSRIYKRMSQML